mmetsp:Transcript_15542/g.22156  ORF Transcript_15542/g.22156 Transcript_15542/m.22156 type:complete len:709 (+) Transcript_15542:289-2415(+)
MQMLSTLHYNVFDGFNCTNPCQTVEALETPLVDVDQSGSNFNYTLLYSHIKLRRWNAALDRLTTSPQEASKWVFEKGENETVEKYLPLHLVCRETVRQYQLVEMLINIYPDAVRTKDHAGRLPLHLFCLGATENTTDSLKKNVEYVRNIMILILSVFPEGMYTKDNRQATPMKIVTDAIQRNGRTLVTDAIVEALTNCHVLLEKQKSLLDESAQECGTEPNSSSEQLHTSRLDNEDKDDRTKGQAIVDDDGSATSTAFTNEGHLSSILSLESDEFKDPKGTLPPPPNGDYSNEEKEVSPNQLSHKSSSEKVIEPIGENAHQHVTANEFLTLNGFQLLAPGESSNEVTALRSRLSKLEAAHKGASETLKELSSKENMYKSTIISLHAQLKDAAEVSDDRKKSAELIDRMRGINIENSQTIDELKAKLNQADQKYHLCKQAIKELQKENKQLHKKLEKALKIAALHEKDKEVLHKVAEMESKEMKLLFRISELESTHSQALLQIQSIGRCDQEIRSVKSDISMLTRSMKAASEDFEMHKLELEDEMTSVSAIVSELRSKVSRDQGIIKNLSKVNASFPSTDGNRGLQLNQTMSAVTEADVELNCVVKQLNDLIAAREKDRDNYTRKIEMLAKEKELTEKENARLRHEMEVFPVSHASRYQGREMDEETDSLKSIARDAREKPNKEAALEEKKRKKAQVQLRNEEMLKYRC